MNLDLDYNKVLDEVTHIYKQYENYNSNNSSFSSFEDYYTKMKSKYNYVAVNLPTIFDKLTTGSLDIKMVTFMIQKANDLKSNKINRHNADLAVGQKLADTLVKQKK